MAVLSARIAIHASSSLLNAVGPARLGGTLPVEICAPAPVGRMAKPTTMTPPVLRRSRRERPVLLLMASALLARRAHGGRGALNGFHDSWIASAAAQVPIHLT